MRDFLLGMIAGSLLTLFGVSVVLAPKPKHASENLVTQQLDTIHKEQKQQTELLKKIERGL